MYDSVEVSKDCNALIVVKKEKITVYTEVEQEYDIIDYIGVKELPGLLPNDPRAFWTIYKAVDQDGKECYVRFLDSNKILMLIAVVYDNYKILYDIRIE